MTSEARGMPDMSLSVETQEDIKAQEEAEKPKEEKEIFQRPDLEIKTPEAIAPKPANKPKRKLTDKQLEALRVGREKSLATRRANQQTKKIETAKKIVEDPANAPAHTQLPPPQVVAPVPPQIIHQQSPIDYDKIILGVTSRMDKLQADRQNREHQVASDISIFEDKIRDDERVRVLNEIEEMQKQEDIKKNSFIAHQHLTKPRPVQSQNPYLYAMDIGARGNSMRNRY